MYRSVAVAGLVALVAMTNGEWCGGKPGQGQGGPVSVVSTNSGLAVQHTHIPPNLLCFDILHNLFCGKCRVEGPATPSDQPSWLAALVADRKATWGKDGFNGTGVFNTPELEWTKTAYIQPQMHPFDRYFYSVEKGNYTVATYLDDVEAR